jgi:hypothetical protein
MKKIFLLAIFYFVSSGYAQNRIENNSPLLKKIKVEKAQAAEFKDQFSVLSKENFSLTGNTQLNHLELMAKCFKWRLVSKTSETAVSEWFYFSFVK